jgi:hypothetical protein
MSSGERGGGMVVGTVRLYDNGRLGRVENVMHSVHWHF